MNEDKEKCECCESEFLTAKMRQDSEDGNWFCFECLESMDLNK